MLKKEQAQIVSVIDTKTLRARIYYLWEHPKYNKKVKRFKDVLVHSDDTSKFVIDQSIEMIKCNPISKLKHYKVC